MKRIKALNVNHPGHQENLNEEKYTLVRDAILQALPVDNGESMPFSELEEKVRQSLNEQNVPKALFPKPGSVRWYTKTVQLDLEARGKIERVPGQSPLRFRLTSAN